MINDDKSWLASEYLTRRVDNTGRLSIPKHLRKKFHCNEGQEVEFFTGYLDGRFYIAISPVEDEEDEDRYV